MALALNVFMSCSTRDWHSRALLAPSADSLDGSGAERL